jgi:hypothetical protein
MDYCSIPVPQFGYKTANGLKKELKKIIEELIKQNDDFLYYFGGIQRGVRIYKQSAQSQQSQQSHQSQQPEQLLQVSQKRSWGNFLSQTVSKIEKGIEKLPTVINRATASAAKLNNAVKRIDSVLGSDVVNIQDIYNAIDIILQTLRGKKKPFAEVADTFVNTECMRNPIALLFEKMRLSTQYKTHAKRLQDSIRSMDTNPTQYEQQLAAYIQYVSTAIDKIVAPLCNLSILGQPKDALAIAARDFFSGSIIRTEKGEEYIDEEGETQTADDTYHNTGVCKDIQELRTPLYYAKNAYFDNIMFGGGKKHNNATKKAKKRAALIAKMKANVRNPNKHPRPMYE